ncbi:MAG: DnaJ domain-containing protein [Burkholderiales bacterium]|nr:DnaJ domain-containing protein [Burkholderiales bacterium]
MPVATGMPPRCAEFNVTPRKKTLYEFLKVPATATDADIQAAYERVGAQLQAQKDRISPDDFDFKLKVLNVAFKTLSSPSERAAYDARIAPPVPEPSSLPAAAPLAIAPLPADAEAMALRAEAMALRADAMTMRADAMALRSGATASYPAFRESSSFSAHLAASAAQRTSSMPRKLAMVVGTMVAVLAIAQVATMVVNSRRAEMAEAAAAAAAANAQANDKVLLQEYYQTHGVRAANRAELELLQAEDRRKDNEQRQADRNKAQAEQNAKRFEDESRRRGEQVSAELRMAELQAKEQARREDERLAWQQKEDQRVKEQIERNRIERQKAEWNSVLRR